MKKTLKIVGVFLFALGVVSIASAAGNKEPAKDTAAAPEKIVVNAMAYGDNSNQEGVNWVRIVKSFEKENPNIEIKYEMLYDEAYHQKVVARLASGDVPDLAYMGADARWGAPWKEASQQYDMRSLIDPEMYNLDLIPLWDRMVKFTKYLLEHQI